MILDDFFISIGDIYQSLTFNLLSKKVSSIINDIRKNPNNFALADNDDFNLIKREIEKSGITGHYANLIHLCSGDEKKKIKKYTSASALAKENIVCFINTLMLFVNHQDKFIANYNRYLKEDDFGQQDISLVYKKFSEFIINNLPDEFGTIPEDDCIKFIISLSAGMSVLCGNEDNKVSADNNGIEYENTCFEILEKNGFKVKKTPATGDFGADLIAEKEGLTFSIQCKNYNNAIGVKAVQEAYSSKEYYCADYAVVCSSAKYTQAALKLANKIEVICISDDKLPKLLDISGQYY